MNHGTPRRARRLSALSPSVAIELLVGYPTPDRYISRDWASGSQSGFTTYGAAHKEALVVT
jgi:hypothetical protein